MKPLKSVPLTSRRATTPTPGGFWDGQVLVAQRNRVLITAFKQILRAACLHTIAEVRHAWCSKVNLVVAVELVARPCCVAQDADQTVIWEVVDGDRLDIGFQLAEASGAIARGLSSMTERLERMGRQRGLVRRYADQLDVGINLLSLIYLLLPVGESARVPDRQSGKDRLGPCCPHFLAETPPRYEPTAVVDRIRHVTALVVGGEIVGGGMD